MKKLLPTTLVIASCALAGGLAAGSLAIANYAPDAEIDAALVEEANSAIHYGPEIADLPAPVMGDELFFGLTGSACMDRDAVISVFLSDQANFGGQTVEIVSGRDQAFADLWRAQTAQDKVEISGVVGHMFQDGDEWTVDVVEFGENGCAMSRTLLPVSTWTGLIETSA